MLAEVPVDPGKTSRLGTLAVNRPDGLGPKVLALMSVTYNNASPKVSRLGGTSYHAPSSSIADTATLQDG